MSRPGLVVAVFLVVVGAIFVGQGTGIIRGGSFMVGDSRWAWIGGTLVLIGVVLGGVAQRRRRG